MTLGKLLTRLLRPCSGVPKSPTPPSSPNVEECKQEAFKDPQSIDVNPCMDISNTVSEPPSQSKDKVAAFDAADSQNVIGVVQDKVAPPDKLGGDVLLAELPTQRTKPQVVTVTEAAKDKSEEVVLDIFGFDVLHQLQGKTWDERGQAVQAVRARVVQFDMNGKPPEDFFFAACCVAQMALKDKVMPVFFDGLDLAKLLLGDFANKQEFQKDAMQMAIDAIVPMIVSKTSDRNARSIEGTRQALVFLARQPALGCQPIMAHILAPIANVKEVAAIRGRLELISHVIDEFGFEKKSGLSLSSVMGFVRPHLDATDEKVRRGGVEVTVSCYSLKGERTLKYCSNLKPALLKLLEQRFAEVDSSKGKGWNGPGSPVSSDSPVKREKLGRKHASSGSSRQSSSSGSVGISSKLNMDRIESRGSHQSLGSRQGTILEDRPTDPFAPANDPLSPAASAFSPAASAFASPEIQIRSPQNQLGTDVDPVGMSSLATHENLPTENPNFIPSPTDITADPFSIDDDDLMNEIEGL